MIFETDGKIRYSEVDSDGNLTIDNMVNYLQDVTMLHSEAVNMGASEIARTGCVWFLSTWQVDIIRTPRIYENVRIKTNPYEFKGFFGNRNVWIETEDGEVLVKANAIWIYLNVETKVPVRVKEAAMAPYMPFEPKIDMEYASRKIPMPQEGFEPLDPIPVREDNLDTNKHVNNCQYIKTAMVAAGIYKMPKRLRSEYKKSALLGDVFYPYVQKEDNVIYVDLRSNEGESYATVVFEY